MPAEHFALKPVTTALMPCKVCGSGAPLFGVVDFHKNCEEARGLRLAPYGVPIYYRRCAACGFLFTDAFDGWSCEQFKQHIYNDDYHIVDPDYRTARPSAKAGVVVALCSAVKRKIHVLDYGGGNDRLCRVLRDNGFASATTYDPMVPEYAQRPPRKFDLVTCFETLEHLPDPNAGLSSIIDCVAEPGLILYSTLVQPANFDKIGLAWWYVGPRNGHVSIFTRQALALAWGRHGYKNVSLTDDLHFAFRTLPAYLAHLQSRADQPAIQSNPAQTSARATAVA
jgi:SAM-dependent methyltransferase